MIQMTYLHISTSPAMIRKPIAWFPGMAGTENMESPNVECTEKGKSVWDRSVAAAGLGSIGSIRCYHGGRTYAT